MYITISEFAKKRNIDKDTVNAWIRKHPDINSCCTIQNKEKTIDITSTAYKVLEKKYPLPKPIEVVEDIETRKKLVQAQEYIVQLQKKIMDMQEELNESNIKIASIQSMQLLIDDKNQQLKEKNNEITYQKNEVAKRDLELNKYHKTFWGLYKKID